MNRSSVYCFLGTIPIKVKCQRESDKSTVPDKNCKPEDKPLTSKPCNAGDCPIAYVWKVEKGFCSATCGKGENI